MNDTGIALFLSLARTNSYTATANEMYVSKQFISKTISDLEEELGTALLLRNNHNVMLTEAGRAYRDFFGQYADILYDRMERSAISNGSRLRVAVDDWLGLTATASDMIHRFSLECGIPVIINEVGEGRAMGLLQAQRVDCVITSRYSAKRLRNLCNIQPLHEAGLRLNVVADHPLASNNDRGMLAQFSYLATYAGEGNTIDVERRVRTLCAGLGFSPRSVDVMENQNEVRINLLLGSGYSIQPQRKAEQNILQIPTRKTVTVVMATLRDRQDEYADLLTGYLGRTGGHRWTTFK